MAKKMNYEDFELSKFNVVDKSGTVSYYDTGSDSLDLHVVDLKNKLHDDLKDKLQELKELMSRRLGFLDVTDSIREKFKKMPKVLEHALELEKQQIDRVNVSGILWKGSGKKKTIQLTGSFTGDQYGTVGTCTPLTRTTEETLGYEQELVDKCEEIKKEVYLHAFKGKKQAEPTDNQTSILDEDQQE